MKQIDQDPSDYRYQKPDGSWGQRVDKKLCRWLGLVAAGFSTYLCWGAAQDLSAGPWLAPAAALMAFCSGALITLSLKSID